MYHRQIVYHGQPLTGNHKGKLDFALRIIEAAINGECPDIHVYNRRFYELIAPHVEVAAPAPDPLAAAAIPAAALAAPALVVAPAPVGVAPVAPAAPAHVAAAAPAAPILAALAPAAAPVPAAPAPVVPPVAPVNDGLFNMMNALINRNNALPPLQPFNGDNDLSVFKNRFRAYANEYGWNLVQQAAKISVFLTGKAAHVYDQLNEVDRCSIDAIFRVFEAHFSPSESEWLARLENLSVAPNQSTREFASKLAEHYDKANPRADPGQRARDLKNRLKNFIPFSYQPIFAMSTRDSAWDNAVDILAAVLPKLNEVDSGEAPASQFVNSISTHTSRPFQQLQQQQQQHANTRSQSNQRSSRNQTNYKAQYNKHRSTTSQPYQVCNRCQQPGHYARECPAPVPIQAPVRQQPRRQLPTTSSGSNQQNKAQQQQNNNK